MPEASVLKLGMTYPLPDRLILELASNVEMLYIIEELDPFLEEQIRALGIKALGKQRFPTTGEFNVKIVAAGFGKQISTNEAGMPSREHLPSGSTVQIHGLGLVGLGGCHNREVCTQGT